MMIPQGNFIEEEYSDGHDQSVNPLFSKSRASGMPLRPPSCSLTRAAAAGQFPEVLARESLPGNGCEIFRGAGRQDRQEQRGQ
jgi:hypothetical protein